MAAVLETLQWHVRRVESHDAFGDASGEYETQRASNVTSLPLPWSFRGDAAGSVLDEYGDL